MATLSSHKPEKYMQRIRYLENCSATWASTPWMSSSLSTNQRRETDAVQAGREDAEAGRSLRVLSLSELQVLLRRMLRLVSRGEQGLHEGSPSSMLPALTSSLSVAQADVLQVLPQRDKAGEPGGSKYGQLSLRAHFMGTITMTEWGQCPAGVKT